VSLAGRVALVTGGGRGIGRAISLGLAEDGADVGVNYRRDEAAARATVADVQALGRRALAYRASVNDWAQDRAMVEAVLRDFGRIDILVNNAGFAPRVTSVVDTDPNELDIAMATHAFGPFYLCKLVLPSMRQQPRGDIVFISSTTALSLPPNMAHYGMSKAAQEALARTLFKEERKHGIHVNTVSPGLTETDMGVKAMRARGVADMRQIDAAQPFGRVCQPADVANVVRFLVSDLASYVTGQRLAVHGGSNVGN